MQLDLAFPTPIYIAEIDNLSAVQNELLNCYSLLVQNNAFTDTTHKQLNNWNSSTANLSNYFQEELISKYKLSSFEAELDKKLKAYFKTMDVQNLPEYKIQASWMSLTKHKEYTHKHAHYQCDVSGVYYIQTNGVDGDISFHSPISTLENSYPFRTVKAIHYPPKVGRLILFPSFLEHEVYENSTQDDRISFSFNIVFNRFI